MAVSIGLGLLCVGVLLITALEGVYDNGAL